MKKTSWYGGMSGQTTAPGMMILAMLFLFLLYDNAFAGEDAQADIASVISGINKLFSENGIRKGLVEADQQGRIVLRGEYEDEVQIDRAFSLAQSVAGVTAVLPVSASDVRVKGLEQPAEEPLLRGPGPKPKKKAEPEPPGPIRNKYALVIGVSEFKNRINPLQYAANDAQNVYHYLTDPSKGNFPKENVFLLTNSDATRENILKAMNRLRTLADKNDVVVFYVSSHGTPPDKYGGVYIVTYDSEVKPRERIWNTSLSEKNLKDFVDNVKAKRLLMMLDACYSNGAFKKIPGFVPTGGKSLGDQDEVYGISSAFAGRLIGAKDIVEEEPAQDKQKKQVRSPLPDDGWGRVLMGASSEGEKSWESVSLQSSIFTFYFFDGLNRFDGAVKDAFDYARPLVAKKVKEEKGEDVEQNSQVIASTNRWNFHIFERSGEALPAAKTPDIGAGKTKEGLDIKLWTDKKVYRAGEKVKIFMSGNRPFYGKLLYRNADGNVLQLLPNPFRKDTFFWSGVVYEVPTDKDRFELEVEAPFGTEQITVYARPSLLGELSLESAGGVYQVRNEEKEIPILVRGIRIKEKTPAQKKEWLGGKGEDMEKAGQQEAEPEYVEKSISIETRKK